MGDSVPEPGAQSHKSDIQSGFPSRLARRAPFIKTKTFYRHEAPLVRSLTRRHLGATHHACAYTAGGIWYLVAPPLSTREYFWFRSKAALRHRLHRRDTLRYPDRECLGVL